MSDKMDYSSLSALATRNAPAARVETLDKDAKSKASAARKSDGFDGFMKTFLGKDKQGKSGKTAGASASAHAHAHAGATAGLEGKTKGKGKTKAADPGAWTGPDAKKSGGNNRHGDSGKLSRQERRALREAMDKTVPAEDMPASDSEYSAMAEFSVAPEVAAGAAEAARLILGLIFPDGAGLDDGAGESGAFSGPDLSGQPGLAGEGSDALNRLAELVGKFASAAGGSESVMAAMGLSGEAGLDAEALFAALDTANASAEMNIAAVLSAIEELLEGMPREALEQALSEAADRMGLSREGGEGDAWFEEIAAALDAEIVEMNTLPGTVNPDRLLAQLGNAYVRLPGESAAAPVGPAVDGLEAVADEASLPVDPAASEKAVAEESGMTDAELPDTRARVADGVVEIPENETGETSESEATEQDESTPVQSGIETESEGGEMAAESVADSTSIAKTPAEAAPPKAEPQPEAKPAASVPAVDEPVVAKNAVEADTEAEPVAEAAESVELPETAVHTGRQNSVAESAKSADDEKVETEIYGLFKQFLKEKISENDSESPINNLVSPDGEVDGAVLDAFAEWLSGLDNFSQFKEMAGDKNKLKLALAAAVIREIAAPGTAAADVPNEDFYEQESNVESVLQNNTGTSAAKPAGTDQQPGQAVRSESGQEQQQQSQPQLSGQTVNASVPAAANSAAQPAQGGTATSMLQQLENIERLAEAMKMANRNGVKNITLELAPPELGKVMLRVQARAGVVSAFLQVEKPETAAQLNHNLQHLRENLKAQGIELGELEVRHQNQNQAAGEQGRRDRNRETDPDADNRQGSGRPDLEAVEAESAEAVGITKRSGKGGLNFFA